MSDQSPDEDPETMPADIRRSRAGVERLQSMALVLLGQIRGGQRELLDLLLQIVGLLVQSRAVMRLQAAAHMRRILVLQMVWDTGLRDRIRSAIGEKNIRQWWWTYSAVQAGRSGHSRRLRPFRRRKSFYQRQYVRAEYGLMPVPGYEKPKQPYRDYGPYLTPGLRDERILPTLFYAWELDGRPEPPPKRKPRAKAAQAPPRRPPLNTPLSRGQTPGPAQQTIRASPYARNV